MEKENNPVIEGMIKASMMKEALASCQLEGIGENITLSDLYLEELKNEQNPAHKTPSVKKRRKVERDLGD